MADRLQSTEVGRQNLLADIAHELRTPVSIIQANLEMIIDGVYKADEGRLKSLYDETRILTELISDLRSLSDLEIGTVPMRSELLRLSAIVDESCRKLRPLFDERGIRLDAPIRRPMKPSSTRRRTSSGKSCGISSATRSSTLPRIPSSRFPSSAPSAPKGVGLSSRRPYRTKGEGIPEGRYGKDLRALLSRRFFASAENQAAGGLGLAICKRIIEASGGEIGACKREPHGLALWFELPIKEEGLGPGGRPLLPLILIGRFPVLLDVVQEGRHPLMDEEVAYPGTGAEE